MQTQSKTLFGRINTFNNQMKYLQGFIQISSSMRPKVTPYLKLKFTPESYTHEPYKDLSFVP